MVAATNPRPLDGWFFGTRVSTGSAQPFIERLRAARSNIKPSDPWTDVLRKIRGQTGHDGVERVATDAVFELLDLPALKRTPEAAKRLKILLVNLGWTPVRSRHVTSRGRARRGRGVMLGCLANLGLAPSKHNTIG